MSNAIRPNVLLITQAPECETFSVCYALNKSGFAVHLLCLESARYLENNDLYLRLVRPLICSMSCSIQGIPKLGWDHVVIETGYYPPSEISLKAVSRLCSGLTLLLPALGPQPALRRIKATIGHLVRFWRLWRHRPNVCINEVVPVADLRRLFARRCQPLGVDTHFSFLVNGELQNSLYSAWETNDVRIHRVNFIGKAAPDKRQSVLNLCRRVLVEEGLIVSAETTAQCPWFEIGKGQNGLEASEYMNLLTNSDFTLCPPGYAVWSHRVVEAILRGSIPVLEIESRDIYDLGLVDGQNCLLVNSDDWPSTIRRLVHLDDSEVVRMRSRLAIMCRERMRPNMLAQSIASRVLG